MKGKRFTVQTARVMAYGTGLFFLFLGLWISRNFGKTELEQILYHFQFGGKALLSAGRDFIASFILHCLLVPLFALFCLCQMKRLDVKMRWLFESRLLIVLMPVLSLIYCLSTISFWTYLRNIPYREFIDRHYVFPMNITPPIQKRNLILIYVESLEETFNNENLFRKGLLKELNDATANGVSFGQFEQAYGTAWTIAGIVSTQCGIPLRPVIFFNKDAPGKKIIGNHLGEKAPLFLPGISCLGDVLKESGYTNVFLGGASLEFAGKGKFFRQHGYDEIVGRDEWTKLGETDMNGWGLTDERLFLQAKDKLDRLVAGGRPFNLTVLTVDMHHPRGFVSTKCRKEGDANFSGAVRCSSKLLSDFIGYVRQRDYDKNTDIVVVGDHLAMPNIVYDLLLREPRRTIYNRFLSRARLVKNRETIYHFCLFPTILHMLGFRFPGNRLGLGASAFGPLDPSFSLHEEKNLTDKLRSRSEIYRQFWGESVKSDRENSFTSTSPNRKNI